MKIRHLLALVLAVVSLWGCATGVHENIPLSWQPTNDVYNVNTATLTGLYAQKIRVMPFADARENRAEIGRNVERDIPRPVTTRDEVAAWCTDRFKTLLRQFGLTVVESDETVVLKGEILQFHVTEDSLYRGTVGIKMTAESPAGDVLWQGVLIGTNKRFGRSYSPENYYETLSDAYLEAVQGLLKNGEFVRAMQKQG